jgi:ABC-type branched-subunit amino acid transport system substrate-binding protein
MRRAAALAVLAVLAGCGGERGAIDQGGRVVGDNLTVYSSLPDPATGVGRDMVDAQKLAIAQAGGRIGRLGINFASVDEGSATADTSALVAGRAAEDVIRDPQVIAVVGALRSDTAMTSLPLYNEAGILLVSPGAAYSGFTSPGLPGEPQDWYPSGHQTFARVIGDDDVQASLLLRAARRVTGRPRVAVEAEAGKAADGLVRSLQLAAEDNPRVRLVDDTARADAVIYAGSDLRSAVGVAESLAREVPRAALVFPDELTRAGIAERLPASVKRRAVFVSSAPEPGSSEELRTFEDAFQASFGHRPDPYAVLAWRAEKRVLEAIGAAGNRANLRRVVVERYMDLSLPPDRYTAFKLRAGGGRDYMSDL